MSSATLGNDAKRALLESIKEYSTQPGVSARELLQLAEAWAWLQSAGQPHGGWSS